MGAARSAEALELDWSGQFRAEYNYIRNYTLDSTDAGDTVDPNRLDAQGNPRGYYIRPGGSSSATFQTLFLKLRPKIIVNDNIYIKSEWWVGDPVYSIFGNGVPYTTDQNQFYSNQNRGSTITAQRYWVELLSDFGTVQVGRAPLHWGLGIVWNNGEGLWDRYHSTADTIRIVSKFGAFSFVPSFNLYSAGLNVGGGATFNTAATPSYSINLGDGGVREYSLALKYENLDDDFEGGLNFIKRLGGAGQDTGSTVSTGGYRGPLGVGAMNYNIWDIFARKRFGRLTLGAEVPITTGFLGTPQGPGLDYSTFAAAAEVDWKITDMWELVLKGGHAPGQPNFGGAIPDNFRAFFFNPAYRLGLMMFNYQFANFSGPNTQNNPAVGPQALRSPYDNPIVNANYLTATGLMHLDKWTFNATLVYAQADVAAQGGSNSYNTWSRSVNSNDAGTDQGKSLGFEADLGAAFQWDEYFQFRVDAGAWMPGDFYKFTGVAGRENRTDVVLGASARVGITF